MSNVVAVEEVTPEGTVFSEKELLVQFINENVFSKLQDVVVPSYKEGSFKEIEGGRKYEIAFNLNFVEVKEDTQLDVVFILRKQYGVNTIASMFIDFIFIPSAHRTFVSTNFGTFEELCVTLTEVIGLTTMDKETVIEYKAIVTELLQTNILASIPSPIKLTASVIGVHLSSGRVTFHHYFGTADSDIQLWLNLTVNRKAVHNLSKATLDCKVSVNNVVLGEKVAEPIEFTGDKDVLVNTMTDLIYQYLITESKDIETVE